MNAYELAEKLYLSFQDTYHEDAANMLRQQAGRIAELEKDGKVCATCGGLVYDAVLPQTKPLSDEEIEEVINRTAWVGTEDEIRVKIARAIEERHGIK